MGRGGCGDRLWMEGWNLGEGGMEGKERSWEEEGRGGEEVSRGEGAREELPWHPFPS